MPTPFTLAIHGGAGTLSRAVLTPEVAAGFHAGLCAALTAGGQVLAAGGTALDAVVAAVMAMEEDPHFNAGRGAVYTSAGRLEMDADRHGTVGAVARDAAGTLAAATSTGGMTGKAPGRVGDCPVIGAGTWADRQVAISATGHGEVFMRHAAAHEIAARIRLAGQGVAEAAAAVVAELGAAGGSGGLIALGAAGEAALPFNCAGMYRGTIGPDGVPRTAIFEEALAAQD